VPYVRQMTSVVLKGLRNLQLDRVFHMGQDWIVMRVPGPESKGIASGKIAMFSSTMPC
jgi:hypothetical protein